MATMGRRVRRLLVAFVVVIAVSVVRPPPFLLPSFLPSFVLLHIFLRFLPAERADAFFRVRANESAALGQTVLKVVGKTTHLGCLQGVIHGELQLMLLLRFTWPRP